MTNIIQQVAKINDRIIEHRHRIHSRPELSFQEYETCQYICNVLSELNIPYQIICNTGIVALIGDAERYSDNCVAFRADMDALPIVEDTGLSFSSLNHGVMHACGHDMHVAMLLGAAEILQNEISKLKGVIKLIFQPGEEYLPGGAKIMIENGALENPTPRMIFAQHIEPAVNVGQFTVAETDAMAATCEIYWTIKGKGTHAAQPHQGNDPIVVAANIISFAQNFMIRYRNPLEAAILSICSINGGSANNIFPDEVKMSGTLRTFNEKTRNEYIELLTVKCKQLAAVYNTECEIDVVYGYPPVINNIKAVEIMKKSVEELFGYDSFAFCEPKMWAEDFAYFANKIPACFYFIGTKNKKDDVFYPLHNAKLNPDEQALEKGTALIVYIAKKVINS